MNAFICDDDARIAEYISFLLKSYQGCAFNVQNFLGEDDLLFYLHGEHRIIPELIFMDINLTSCNGINLAAKILKDFPTIKVIFITAEVRYCQDIFAAKPVAFLLKPIDSTRFNNALQLAIQQIESEQANIIMVNTQKTIFKLYLSKIVYIESRLRKVIYHTDEREYEVYAHLSDVEQRLSKNFVRCHKSYIVNLDFATSLEGVFIVLHNGEKISVSNSKIRAVKQRFTEYLSETL